MTAADNQRTFLLVLLLLAIALFGYVASPFARPLLVAATFAAALSPANERLVARLRGKRALAAALLSAAFLLALAGPVAWVVTVVVGQVVDGVQWLRAALASEGVAGLIARLPDGLQPHAERLAESIPGGVEEALALLPGGGGQAAQALGGLLTATGSLVVKGIILLVALFFLLVEGPRLVSWLEEITPMAPGRLRELLSAFRGAVMAVVVSTLATAGVQAALAVVGYAVAGIPNAAFFGLLTFVAALVPLVGANIVVLPIAVLHFAAGHHVGGVLLALWGLGAVGTVDNVLKPVLMRRGLAVHISLVFLALLGGLATLGPIGLIAGPLALAFFLATLRIWHRDYGAGARGEAAPVSPPP